MESKEDNSLKASQAFNLKDLLWLCVSHWYWFVISLAITCGYAVYYIAKTSKVYVATAGIIVKDNNGGSPDIAQTFAEIGSMRTNVNLNNEMTAIKSPTITDEVVRRLGLDVDYSTKSGLRTLSLYGPNLPFTIKFLDLKDNSQASLNADYHGNGQLTLTAFSHSSLGTVPGSSDKIEIDLAKSANDTIQSPLGRILVSPNDKYETQFDSPVDIDISRIGYQAASDRIQAALKTEQADVYSSFIAITLEDVNTDRAKDVMQCIIDVYNENWMADRNLATVLTSNFINERLGVIESELGDVDTDISNYKAEHQIADVGGVASTYFGRAMSASDKIMEITNKRQLARQVRDHLSNITGAYEVLPASSGLSNVGIESQIAQYNQLVIDRNNLIANSSLSNPVITDIDFRLAGIRQAILTAIDSYITSLNAELQATQTMEAVSASRLAANPSQARHLLSFERQQKVKESLYLYLLQKREENELSQAFTAYNTKLVNPPAVYGPVSPNESKIFATAIAIGLLVPAALIFLFEMLNTKVRGRRDIEQLTVPFAGEVPYAGKKPSIMQRISGKMPELKNAEQILVKRRSSNVINEAFRVIRTNLEFMIPATLTESRVIMLTSANPGSGKTFVSVNLATVLSLKGNRVALLDLDLRRASLSEVANSPVMGLTNYLTGTASPEQIVVSNLEGNEGVDLYPVGPIPPNPSELLYSDRLVKLIEYLRGSYDYILIDCPPAEVVADAKIINRLVDLTIFVIRAGLLERGMLAEIQKFYDRNRYKHMAIILNGTYDPSGSLLGHGYRYGYGYGYGYGYVKSNKKKPRLEEDDNKKA